MTGGPLDHFINRIVTHPAFSHSVFSVLAERPVSPDKLSAYLRAMGAFCEASRFPGRIAEQLRNIGFANEADVISDIFQSDVGRAGEYALMAKDLVEFPAEEFQAWCTFSQDVLPKGVHDAIWMLNDRGVIMTRRELGEALGVMLVVELAMHRSIIPGQVQAFDESNFYSLTVGGASYLDGHGKEEGAEQSHEERMIRVITVLLSVDGVREGIEDGATKFLPMLNAFYDDLLTAIR